MIAILGATGYIGRSLARRMAVDGQEPLVLFARNPASFADEVWPEHVSHRSVADFHAGDFDVVINAIGAGDPGRVANIGAEILDVTQAWDNRVTSTMGPRTRYVFLSSGAVYGSSFERPIGAHSVLSLPVNQLGTVAPYTYAEARHRYLAELARSIATRLPFVTTPHDMVRDYAGA
jgi:nucleoside-diphosphate-sugar epimerase